MMSMRKMGLIAGLALVMVGCGREDGNTLVEKDNTKADVVVEEISETVDMQTEVWEEKDKETGEEFIVTVVKYIEDGKVVRTSESRELLNEGELDKEEILISDEMAELGVIETEEDLQKFINSGRVSDIGEGTVTLTDEKGNVVEELTIAEYEESLEKELEESEEE